MTSRLSRRIRQVMTRSGMNMRELADASGVPYGWVRQIVAGGIARPDAVRLSKLAAALGIPPSELLALSDQLGSVEGQDAVSVAATPDLATAIRDLTVEIGEWLARGRRRVHGCAVPARAGAVFQSRSRRSAR